MILTMTLTNNNNWSMKVSPKQHFVAMYSLNNSYNIDGENIKKIISYTSIINSRLLINMCENYYYNNITRGLHLYCNCCNEVREKFLNNYNEFLKDIDIEITMWYCNCVDTDLECGCECECYYKKIKFDKFAKEFINTEIINEFKEDLQKMKEYANTNNNLEEDN
jgi:hypothetical protein